MKNGKMLKTAAIAASVFALGLIAVACDGGNEGNDGNNNTNEPVTYAVTYSLNGGSGTLPTEGNKEAGEKFNLAASTGLTKEDHTFDGWSDGTTKYAAGAEYTMPSHAVTFTAQWKESDNNGGNTGTPTVKYHVTYSLNGGSGTLPTESDKAEGEKFNLAASTGLIKENHTFNGWSDGTTTYAAGAEYTMPAENVTLTAQWKENEVFLFNQHVNAMIQYVDSESNNGGYLILSEDGTGLLNIYDSDYEYIIYNYFDYTVSDGVLTVKNVSADSYYVTPVVSAATGTVDKNSVSITLANGSDKYVFQSVLYKIETANNIPNSTGMSTYYPENMILDLTDVEDTNYISVKINGEVKDNEYLQSFTMPAENVVVEYTYNIYRIVYKSGDGDGDDYIDISTSTSYRLLNNTKTNFTRDGYAFAGWTVGGQDKNTGSTVTLSGDNTEVTARWNKRHTISYSNVDMSGVETNFTSSTQTQYTSTAIYNLPYGKRQSGILSTAIYFSRAGYTLKGWTSSADNGTDKDGTVYDPGSRYKLQQDTVFTAVWEKITYYTVTYDLAGGTGTLPTQNNMIEGETFTLASSSGLSNGDKVFGGWNDGTKTYAAGATYTMPASNVILTAVWNDATTPPVVEGELTYTGTLTIGFYKYTQITINTQTLAYSYAGSKNGTGTAEAVSGKDRAYKIDIGGEDYWILISEDGNSLQIFDYNTMDVDRDLIGTFTRQA